MVFDTVFRETRSGRNVGQIIVLPDPDVSEPDTVSEDELDRTFQQSHSSSDDEVIEEDDASANARRKLYIWCRRPFNPKTEAFIESDEEISPVLRSIEYFRIYFTPQLLSHISFETNRKATQCLYSNLVTTVAEMEGLIGMLITMGVSEMPRYRNDNDKVVMDRSHPDYDRFYKIRSLIESIRKICLEEAPEELQSVGEYIIPYKGRCKMKMRKNGFVHDFWLCDGMAPKVENPVDLFAADVVMKVCETLPKHKGYTAEVAQCQATHGICKSTLASRQVELARRTKGCEWFSTCVTRNDCNKPAQLQQIASLTPLEVWSKVFADEMIDLITFQSNLYAHRECNNRAFTVSSQEIRQFIGVILLSGYNCQPEAKHDWSTQPDIGAQGAISCMSHNCFMEIKKYLHLAHNQKLVKGDKMSKVTPLYKLLNSSLVKHGMFHEKLSVDESIVPYFRRHATKMFLKGKPIRFGYKVWMLCGNDGYPYHMTIYQGKEIHAPKVPLSTRVNIYICYA
ncbi:PiggyBac transposable element-derived protein 3 [Trichinella patagoniensis]|uniref:PiggyBac transposable element-derived protein 3 n=2 Tax=Trichinella patagoniensis TaxID=990121 RepID=A0A0V0Z457_9BILA|nr:PiggyBac transposable element-derived protein 3 [Trichinella patagoniensis]